MNCKKKEQKTKSKTKQNKTFFLLPQQTLEGRIDIILVKSHEKTAGPDWTSRYNGSVSRLVAAIQQGRDSLPPTGGK